MTARILATYSAEASLLPLLPLAPVYLLNTIPNIKDEDNIIECNYQTAENLTRTSLFRMKPFLLSYQRYIMYIECIKKIEDAGGKILKIKKLKLILSH